MNNAQDYSRNEAQLEIILLVNIAVLCAFIVFYLGWTILKRIQKAKKDKRRKTFQSHADRLLFGLLFDQITMQEAVQDYIGLEINDNLCRKIFIRSIIGLHRSYSGNQKEKLEDFYRKSRLVDYSLAKLNRTDWAAKIEAIRDLSTLNCQHAYEQIRELIHHPHDLVRKEALIAIVKLKGVGELLSAKQGTLFLDDWTQANILYTIKTLQLPADENVHRLLTSNNESEVVLGARLIDFYQLKQYTSAIRSASAVMKRQQNKAELERVIERLNKIVTA